MIYSKLAVVLALALIFVATTNGKPAPKDKDKDKNKDKDEDKDNGIGKPTDPDRSVDGEGFDVLLTEQQFKTIRPGALNAFAGRCDAPFNTAIWKRGSWKNLRAEDCVEWCINANAETSREMGACQFYDNGFLKACSVFPASAFDEHVESKPWKDAKCWSLLPSDDEPDRRTKRALIPDSLLWPNNEVIYDIVPATDPDSWESNGINQAFAEQNVQDAFNHYHTNTFVRFVQRTTETQYIKIGYFGGGCSSYVGKMTFVQPVTLGWCWNSPGSIIHELGHASGLWHEHTRRDRNTYLSVPSGANSNFNIAGSSDSRDTESTPNPYDFGSIMHYPLTTSWSDGEGGSDTVTMNKTIEGDVRHAEQGNTQIGQRRGLSELDVYGLSLLYPDQNAPTPSPVVPPPISQGTLQSGDNKIGNTNSPGKSELGGSSFDNTFDVIVNAQATYTFTTCSGASFDTYLRLYDANLNQIATNDDSCDLLSTITIDLSPGVAYTLLVEGYGTTSGSYVVEMTSSLATPSPTPPPTPPTMSPTSTPTASTPTLSPMIAATVDQGPINVGDTKTGDTNVPGINTLGNAAPDHTYDVVVTETAIFEFSTCAGTDSYDTYLRLYDAVGSLITSNDDSCGLLSVISRELAPGEYTLLVEGYSANAGTYTLTMTASSPPTPPPTPAPTTPSPTTSTPIPAPTPAPTTSSPTTSSPTTSTPNPAPTPVPTTSSPTTSTPTPAPTPAPTTSSPTTSSPTTSTPTPAPTPAPTTPSPTTSSPTPAPTPAPTTSSPTTSSPTTSTPTPAPTPTPTTSSPTTSSPTTSTPTPAPTSAPTTPSPTTSTPTTSTPTPAPTPAPTTSSPTTSTPTPAPTPTPTTSSPTTSSPATSTPTPAPTPAPSTPSPTTSTPTPSPTPAPTTQSPTTSAPTPAPPQCLNKRDRCTPGVDTCCNSNWVCRPNRRGVNKCLRG